MEPIKPIEGTLKDGEGQASVLAKVVREHYWQRQAREMTAVEAGEEASQTTEKQQGQGEKKPGVQTQYTYAEFEINQETRTVIVHIIDAESGKLVRTIPPEDLAKEIAKGNFHPNQLRRRAIVV
jgi:uncharacterized FlaG/YvyC family protein